jgi:hypothetical protein
MSHYLIALYLHILGALGFFIALGLEWTSLRRMRASVDASEIRQWLSLANGSGRLGMPSMLLLLISGGLMTYSVWKMVAWVMVSLGALVLLIVVTVALSRRPMAAIEQAVAGEKGTASPALREVVRNPMLWMVMQVRVAIALGIVFLMTVKPDLTGSLLAIGVAAGLGLIVALLVRGRGQAQAEPEGSLAG